MDDDPEGEPAQGSGKGKAPAVTQQNAAAMLKPEQWASLARENPVQMAWTVKWSGANSLMPVRPVVLWSVDGTLEPSKAFRLRSCGEPTSTSGGGPNK